MLSTACMLSGRLFISPIPLIMHIFDDKPGVNRKELDYVLEYSLSAMIGIMSYWFNQDDPISSERLRELIHRPMEQGVLKQLPF